MVLPSTYTQFRYRNRSFARRWYFSSPFFFFIFIFGHLPRIIRLDLCAFFRSTSQRGLYQYCLPVNVSLNFQWVSLCFNALKSMQSLITFISESKLWTFCGLVQSSCRVWRIRNYCGASCRIIGMIMIFLFATPYNLIFKSILIDKLITAIFTV